MDIAGLKADLQPEHVKENIPLAPFTTWKIGGKADLLLEAKTVEELVSAVKAARVRAIPVTILGWGSNVLISDAGIRGLVIRNQISGISLDGESIVAETPVSKPKARLAQVDTKNYYSFAELDYDESDQAKVQVTLDSGVYLPLAINTLISKGITGLQWFSGIPGTIGGAIYNNIHGGSHFLSEYIVSAEVFTPDNELKTLTNADMNFDYDESRFHQSQEIILRGKFALHKGDAERAKQVSVAWASRKRLQPHNSAGCCFKNITPTEQQKLQLESNSWGFICDQILKLKGTSIGGAKLSEKHAAFIENIGGASAKDVLALYKLVSQKSLDKLGIRPRPEIFFLGFSPEQLQDIV